MIEGLITRALTLGGGGGSEPAVVGYKYIYENGIYHASDDEDYYGNPLDGYDEVEVWVDSEPTINDITAKKNGLYISADYNCDAFGTVTVSVGEDFDFCDKPSIDEITPIIDGEYFVYDRDASFGISCEAIGDGTVLVVYKVSTSGWKQEIYRTSSSFHYNPASYVTITNSSTGAFTIHYSWTDLQPDRWRTINRTSSSVIGYGASAHTFTAVKK